MVRHNTPEPRTNPPEPTYVSDSHHLETEPVVDIDGPSVKEAEMVDGDVFAVVHKHRECIREGCNAERRVHYLFTLEMVPKDARDLVEKVAIDPEEFIATNCRITNWDFEDPVLSVGVEDDEYGPIYATKEYEYENTTKGDCYGRHEPDPERY